MASKILAKIDLFSHSSFFDENILDVVINYYISDFAPNLPYGQVTVRADVTQSEVQFVNDIKTLLADYINATFDTTFNIADVTGCSI